MQYKWKDFKVGQYWTNSKFYGQVMWEIIKKDNNGITWKCIKHTDDKLVYTEEISSSLKHFNQDFCLMDIAAVNQIKSEML